MVRTHVCVRERVCVRARALVCACVGVRVRSCEEVSDRTLSPSPEWILATREPSLGMDCRQETPAYRFVRSNAQARESGPLTRLSGRESASVRALKTTVSARKRECQGP
jgi:hypothetical protein